MSTFDSIAYGTQNGTYKAINPVVSRIGDFSPFYIAIAICSIILGFLLILNVICCCSRYSDYWLDRHTGNRWVVSIWSTTPHKQPPLDYTELEFPNENIQYVIPYHTTFHKESELQASLSQQPLSSREFGQTHTKESDL